MILTPSILIKHLVVVAVMVVVVDGCSAAAPETAVAIVIKTTRTDTDQVPWELGAVVITAAVATEGQQQRHALMHP